MGISNGHVIHLDNKLKESIKFFLLKDSNINKSNIKENTALIKNITILFDNKINGKLIEILPFKNQFLQIEYISRYYLHKIINIKTIYGVGGGKIQSSSRLIDNAIKFMRDK